MLRVQHKANTPLLLEPAFGCSRIVDNSVNQQIELEPR